MATLAEAFPDVAKEWHPTKNGDRTPHNTTSRNSYRAWWMGECGHEWDAIVANRTKPNGGTGCPYCNSKRLLVGFNDMATVLPDIVPEWHTTKNELSPHEIIGTGGKYTAWWLGECGHEWESTIANRSVGKGCPFCSNQRVLAGFNDVATIAPHLANELADPSIDVLSMNAYSTEELLWRCSQGHEWYASISRRVKVESGCQKCNYEAGWYQRGHDIATVHPEVAALWNHDKNGDVAPSSLEATVGNPETFWWIADCGHEWTATIRNMVRSDSCRVCSGSQILAGYNDFATVHGDLVSYWSKSNELKPSEVSRGSNQVIAWVCDKGHEWEESPAQFVRRGTCKECNSETLAGKFPELAALWHPTKNGDLKPDDFAPFSQQSVWWLGECGHETYQRIDHKYLHCKTCSKRMSLGEQEVRAYLDELGVEYEANYCGILPEGSFDKRNEVDIWIPSANLAIEYNGVYWHSGFEPDTRSFRNMHALRAIGVQMMVIWEDDWYGRQDIVKAMLAAKLTPNNRPMVQAKKTKARYVSAESAEAFLKQNHIQGYRHATYHFGLFDGERMVAIMSVVDQGDYHEIARYAATGVYGGYSKLMRYAERELNIKKWVTFSDNEVSDGSMYQKLGFVHDGELKPRYWYIINHARVNHQRWTKKKMLKRGMGTPDMTEFEIARANNMRRAYDCGRVRWMKFVV